MGYERMTDANIITQRYMDSILIEQRLIDSVVADTSTVFFDEEFESPVMTPAFSHLGNYKGRENDGMMENDRFQKNIVDCGISSGADVFKALALGADACAVGRSMLPALEEGGTAGVAGFIREISNNLRYIMSFTGSSSVSDIDPSVLHFTGQWM